MEELDKEFQRRKEWKKKYVNPVVCEDGENSHKWEEDVMREDGDEYTIIICRKCGYWM